jgi:hypothetical protein
MDLLIPLVVLLPLGGFVFTAIAGRRIQARYGRSAASVVPVAAVVVAWAIGMVIAGLALSGAEPFGHTGHGVKLFDSSSPTRGWWCSWPGSLSGSAAIS